MDKRAWPATEESDMTERLNNNNMLNKLGPGNNKLTVCFRTYLFLDELTMVIDSAYQDLL